MIEDAPSAYLVYVPSSVCVICSHREYPDVTRIDLVHGLYRATEWAWPTHTEVWVEGTHANGWSHYKIRLCGGCEPTFRVNMDAVVRHMRAPGSQLDEQDLTDTKPPVGVE